MVEAAVAVAAQPDLRAVLETTVRTAREATGARYAAVGVIGADGYLSEFVHGGMDPERARAIGPPPVGKGLLGTLIKDPVPLRLGRIADHPESVGFPPGHPEMTTFLGVPIKVGDAVFGNLYLADKPGGFSDEDEVIVGALATIAGGAVVSAHVNDQLSRVTVVEDRERIARDLHDAVIQDLIAVGFTIQSFAGHLDDPTARAGLDDAVDRIDDAIDELRASIFDLRSVQRAASDPVVALGHLVQGLAGLTRVNLDVEDADLGGLGADVVDDALLIVQEAVSNAVRHGGVDSISVSARRTGRWLELIVEDDGTGFDTTVPTEGMGIANIRARAAKAGGEVRISSSPGVGTVVDVRIPTWSTEQADTASS